MPVVLPIEIIDLILLHSIRQDGPAHILADLSTTASEQQGSRSRHPEQMVDSAQAASMCRLSKHHSVRFRLELYRHIALMDASSVALLSSTVTKSPVLGTNVQTLVLLPDHTCSRPSPASERPTSDAALGSADPTQADLILSACPNVTHLLLSCDLFNNLSRGLYRLHRPKELTLVNATTAADLDGIVTRHRDLTTVALQRDPRMQAVLGSATHAQVAHAGVVPELPTPDQSNSRSLTHLHLVNFDGRLIHHLATVSSLTYLVLTDPLIPETRPGVPGLSIIPRSHLMLLLGTGNIARIVIRADLVTCIRLMEELAPIEDRKLVFHPIRKRGEPIFANSSAHSDIVDTLSDRASALYDAISLNELDLLAEFFGRVRFGLRNVGNPTSSATDPDTSRDSSGPGSHGRSSYGSSGAVSQGALTESGEDDGSDYFGEDLNSSDVEDHPHPHPAQTPATQPPRATNTNAPPLNIPIEELLRSEGFTPAGLADQASQASSTQPSSGSSRRRSRNPRGPFVLRRNDLRGATQANVDVCAELYEALAAEAGIEQEMNFW